MSKIFISYNRDSIAMARDRLMKWADSGFGTGSERYWLALIEPAMIADPGKRVMTSAPSCGRNSGKSSVRSTAHWRAR